MDNTKPTDPNMPVGPGDYVSGQEAVESCGSARVIGTLHASTSVELASLPGTGHKETPMIHSRQPTSALDALNDAWQQRIGAAKNVWGRLTDEELLRTQGHEDSLASLIQRRYAISFEEAGRQIRTFTDRYRV